MKLIDYAMLAFLLPCLLCAPVLAHAKPEATPAQVTATYDDKDITVVLTKLQVEKRLYSLSRYSALDTLKYASIGSQNGLQVPD
jgi:hypothetical protein